MKVSVYTANDAGEYELGNNTGDSGSYINISGSNSNIGYNPFTIVTSTDEGNYNTDSFTLTNDPPSRTTSILQGSRISAFAQLPYDADYVVSKIVVRYKNAEGEIVKDTSAYCNSIYTYTDSITQVKYLRVQFGLNSWIMPNRDDYDIGVYLIKAKQVHSKVVLNSADGTAIKLTESEPDSNGYITYTLVNSDGSNYTMPSLNDVYINVVFEAKSTSTINIDYTYTEQKKKSCYRLCKTDFKVQIILKF